jgi:hypothetical protein
MVNDLSRTPCLSIIEGSDQQPHPLFIDPKLNMEEHVAHQCAALGTDLTGGHWGCVWGWGWGAEAPDRKL